MMLKNIEGKQTCVFCKISFKTNVITANNSRKTESENMKERERKAVLKMQARRREEWCMWYRCWCCPSSTALSVCCGLIYNCLLEPSTDFIPKIPKTNSKTFGGRSFGYIAPTVWNSLPADLRASLSLPTFEANLKTYLLRQAF